MAIRYGKPGFARGVQGSVCLVVGLTAKFVVVPSRDGALGVIGVSGRASLTYEV